MIKLAISANLDVEIFRYTDPDLGPRKIPDVTFATSDQLVVMRDEDVIVFNEDVPNSEIRIQFDGSGDSKKLGDEVIYLVFEKSKDN